MSYYEKLKAKKKGETLFLGPRDKRSPPRGDMVIVKRGAKFLYLAHPNAIESATIRGENIAECHSERVEMKKFGDGIPRTTGYPQLRVYMDRDDFEESNKRDALLSDITTNYTGYMALSRVLRKATTDELVSITNLLKELEERD